MESFIKAYVIKDLKKMYKENNTGRKQKTKLKEYTMRGQRGKINKNIYF